MIVKNFVIKKGSFFEGDTISKRVMEMQIDENSFFSVIDMRFATMLDLEFRTEKRIILLEGREVECDVAGPVIISFGDRSSLGLICVLPKLERAILGRRALMEMDLVVDKVTGELKYKIPETIFVKTKIKELS